MSGEEIQKIIRAKRLYQWEVAEQLKINEFTLSRWLRGALDKERSELILNAIDELCKKE